MTDPTLDDRYELGDRIGQGGMAEVVEAYDRKLGRRVAVKLLRHGASDPRARDRFVHEAQVAARFNHPNVVAVYDVGDATAAQPYLVMELVEGPTLRDVIDERGALSVTQALVAADAVLAALGAAHAHGLVHRDVKPANVLISKDGRVKLADFGIAKALQGTTAGLTATGQIIGTPAYLSPEQVDGHDATPRTDLYAVGVLLHEMLAGVPPFQADQPFAVALAHRNDQPPPLDTIRADLPPGLAGVVSRALEKDPRRRFADAAEMRAALTAARSGTGPPADATVATYVPGGTRTMPVPEGPAVPSTARRTTRTAPKKRGKSTAGLAVFVATALAGAGVGLLIFRSTTDGGHRRGAGVETAPPSLSVSVPTIATTTTITLPSTLDGLIAAMANGPSAFGPRGEELFERLVDLRQDPQDRDVEHLTREIQGWVEKGELDPNLGSLTIQILTNTFPEAFSGPGNRGKGED